MFTPKQMQEHRLNEGLSLRAAALKLNVPKRLLQALEAGEDVRPHPHNAKALADFYGCKVTDLWPIPDGERAA